MTGRFAAPQRLAALTCALLLSTAAQAHTTYGGTARDFGSFGDAGGTVVIDNQTISSGYGWADGTDADYGDAHRIRAFKLVLTDTMQITLTAEAFAGATSSSIGGLLPGFSIYSGLFHESPAAADYDHAAATEVWQDANLAGGSAAYEGALNSLGNFAIGNDDGNLSFLTYIGNFADGTAANFGNAAGINGDGLADGIVTGTFTLGPGSYSIIIGGADYGLQNVEGPTTFPNYGLRATLTAAPVPEAETYAMMLAGLGLVGFVARRRTRG